jgi:tetrahydromethanopterin S-methyltransferase subunit F
MHRNLTLFLLMLSAGFVIAQPKVNSPLSHLGIGEEVLNQGHHLEMMGGLYAGFNDAALVNTVNPAALGFMKLTALDVAVSAGSHELISGDQSSRSNVGALHHLTLAFPLQNTISEVLERKSGKSSWVMALDLRSNTNVGYSVSVIDSLNDVGRFRRTYDGSGGTYNFGWLTSYRFGNFSFGADIGVLFGNIESRREVTFLELLNPANDVFEDDINVNAFRWKLGAQYRLQLNKGEDNDLRKRYLSIGIYGHSNSDMSTSGTSFYTSNRLIGGIVDTLLNETEVEGSGVYPGRIGFGMYMQPDDRWTVGFNAELNNWSAYESDALSLGEFDNGFKLGVGGSLRPDADAFGNYFKRVFYKGGFQYGRDGRINNGTNVTNYQVNFGMTMPFYYLRQISHVHLGFNYRRTDAGSIKENYYGVSLGVTFNDNQWFLQRKFN